MQMLQARFKCDSTLMTVVNTPEFKSFYQQTINQQVGIQHLEINILWHNKEYRKTLTNVIIEPSVLHIHAIQ
jgi:hypothetical protein